MDERKKTIKLLEGQRNSAESDGNLLLEKLGEILLGRITETDSYSSEVSFFLAEYRRLIKDIADSEAYIAATEADMGRLKELEAHITVQENKHSQALQELSSMHRDLGKLVMDEPDLEEFGRTYKKQIETLIPKIQSLEERLEKLEDKDGANVFAWIGKNAQGMVLRSFLDNSRENLKRIYGSVGEQLVVPDDRSIANDKILICMHERDELRKVIAELSEEITVAKNECRVINNTFGADGGPVKRIHDMEKHIVHVNTELKSLYLKVGSYTAKPEGHNEFDMILDADDILLLDRVRVIHETIKGIERQIEKLKAELAIDAEKAEIEKFKRSIDEHNKRISQSETAITDLEGRISASEQRIETLKLSL